MSVKQFRVSKGLNQLEMANIIGISQSAYSRKEQGLIEFNITDIKSIQTYFKLPLLILTRSSLNSLFFLIINMSHSHINTLRRHFFTTYYVM